MAGSCSARGLGVFIFPESIAVRELSIAFSHTGKLRSLTGENIGVLAHAFNLVKQIWGKKS
jgi:hypothetical protein